jgi:GC-rich sequence DNA-binding factor
MREMVRKAEAKRSWFVAFRGWVESVTPFLEERVRAISWSLCERFKCWSRFQFPQLEKLEDEHLSILKEQSDMITQRRHPDDEDDLSLFFGTLPTPP